MPSVSNFLKNKRSRVKTNNMSYAHGALTHFRLNKLPICYILEESNFSFRYVRLCDIDVPRENGYCPFGITQKDFFAWRFILNENV